METRALVPASPQAPHSVVETARFEENAFPGLTGNPDPRKDFYFWHALTSAAEVTIPVALPSLAAASAVSLRVFVHGATDHPDQAHRVELRWNGQSLGTFDLLGRTFHVLELPLDGVAATADNELVIAQHVLGRALPVVYVDAVEVDYLREARAEGPSFRFGASADGVHTINGLTEGSVDLYDVTDAGSPGTDVLRAELTEAAFSDAETIGEAILRAHRAASEAPAQLHRVYALLGDPALRLRAPTADRDLNDPSASGEPVAGQGDEASWGSSGCQIGPGGATDGRPITLTTDLHAVARIARL
jgi:hypothetical protein